MLTFQVKSSKFFLIWFVDNAQRSGFSPAARWLEYHSSNQHTLSNFQVRTEQAHKFLCLLFLFWKQNKGDSINFYLIFQ